MTLPQERHPVPYFHFLTSSNSQLLMPLSLFHAFCGHWESLKRMNRLFNAGQLRRSITSFPTSLANVYPVILLSISSILAILAYSSFSNCVQQICVSTPLCVRLFLPWIPCSLYLPLLESYVSSNSQFNSLPLWCLSPILLQETDFFSQKC